MASLPSTDFGYLVPTLISKSELKSEKKLGGAYEKGGDYLVSPAGVSIRYPWLRCFTCCVSFLCKLNKNDLIYRKSEKEQDYKKL